MEHVQSSQRTPGITAAASPPAKSASVHSKAFDAALTDASERLQPVKGHGYSKVQAGDRAGLYVNRSHNSRNGETFDMVRRDGRTWHVYGHGADRIAVEVPGAAKADATQPAGGTPAPSAT